jgi:hypothetical protein
MSESGTIAYRYAKRSALLACAAIARARYHVASASLASVLGPVVTCNADRLRFESFSGCCGVHARLDLPPGALDAAPVASGAGNAPAIREQFASATEAARRLLALT